jgi:hypothetical protein
VSLLSPFPLLWTLWGFTRRVVLAVATAGLPAGPSFSRQAPELRSTEKQLRIGPQWPSLPLGSSAPGLGKVHLSRTTAGQPGQAGGTVRGCQQGPALPALASQCAPTHGCPVPQPMSCQCHHPWAPPHPPHAPLCQSCCRVWCCAPLLGAGAAHPPLVYSLPGRFFADF